MRREKLVSLLEHLESHPCMASSTLDKTLLSLDEEIERVVADL